MGAADSVKLVSPRSSTDEKVRGLVKNMGGPIKFLYITMFKIVKNWFSVRLSMKSFRGVWCWCPGSTRNQGISNYDIDFELTIAIVKFVW